MMNSSNIPISDNLTLWVLIKVAMVIVLLFVLADSGYSTEPESVPAIRESDMTGPEFYDEPMVAGYMWYEETDMTASEKSNEKMNK